MFRSLFSLSALLCSSLVLAQPGEILLRGGVPARTGLTAPLDIPLVLSGNFGELRTDHFHTGLDFKTEGRSGIPVLAAHDGVVARVRIGPWGYGHALYLKSADGLTTVYAHLERFAPVVADWARVKQAEAASFSIDVHPRRAMAFSQGDTIGWSGNTGGSMGPHLHFEVRDTRTERPVNPLLWDLPIADSRPPELGAIWVLPSGDGGRAPLRLGPHDRSAEVPCDSTKGTVRIAVAALDYLDAAWNRCGVYQAELAMDDVTVFAWKVDSLDFSVKRAMNAHALYPQWRTRENGQVHRMHRLPGNRLPIYWAKSRSGEIPIASGDTLSGRLTVSDVHGNTSIRTFTLYGTVAEHASAPLPDLNSFDRAGRFEGSGVTVEVPAGASYADYAFDLTEWGDDGRAIGSADLPLDAAVNVNWKGFQPNATGYFAARWLDGSRDGVYPARVGPSGTATFSTRTLGEFTMERDTIGPEIAQWKAGTSPEGFATLEFHVTDDGSGVAVLSATIDGKWCLMHWDPKNSRMWHEQRNGRVRGLLRLEVTDEVGNISVWERALR